MVRFRHFRSGLPLVQFKKTRTATKLRVMNCFQTKNELPKYETFISDSKMEDQTMMSAVLQLWKIHNPKQKKAEKSGICANDHLGVQCTG